jgi:hypothetical protein
VVVEAERKLERRFELSLTALLLKGLEQHTRLLLLSGLVLVICCP